MLLIRFLSWMEKFRIIINKQFKRDFLFYHLLQIYYKEYTYD